MDCEIVSETTDCASAESVQQVQTQALPAGKPKRDIIHFISDTPVAINMEHVCSMRLEEKTIYFDFYTKMQPVELADAEIAKKTFQSLMNVWCANVVE